MVEAPGTAPGSALLIPQHVYRHSWFPSNINIEVIAQLLKNSFGLNALYTLNIYILAAFSTKFH